MTNTMTFFKDKDATNIDYMMDWSDWLQAGESITASTWTVPTGLTQGATAFDSTTTTIFLGGGVKGTAYEVSCQILTNQGRDPERSIILKIT